MEGRGKRGRERLGRDERGKGKGDDATPS